VGARGAAAGGYAVSIGRDCLVGREDLWDSGAAAGGFQSGFRLGSESFSRGGHVCAFTYDYVKTRPEHPAPHDLSATQSEAARSECVVPEAAPALGSSSFITDATGYAVQHLQPACRSFGAGRYLPFGETFVDQQNGYDSRYTFSAKEKDDETQYSYFGARYYDSDLSVWLSVDPLSDKYPNQSPYSYVGNRPINVIDPNGMDEWEVDGAGTVTWIKASEKHVLYSVDAKGNRTNKSITIKNREILDQLSSQKCTTDDGSTLSYAIGGENTQDDMVKTFKFLADNSNVEWRVDRYLDDGNTMYSLGTLHDVGFSPNASDMGHSQSSVVAFIHSHPSAKNNFAAEISSMGYWESKKSIAGDSYKKAKVKGYENSLYYTYFPNSENLWIVNGMKKPGYINNLKGNYKNFFFGTINTR